MHIKMVHETHLEPVRRLYHGLQQNGITTGRFLSEECSIACILVVLLFLSIADVLLLK